MKPILTTILAATVGLTSALAEPAKSDFFTFSAKTAQRGKTEDKYKDSSGASVRETVRSQAVDASVFFTRGPSVQYSVQCFFIAQDEDTKEQYIYDAQTQPVEGSKGAFTFTAPPLTGTVRRSKSFPVSGMTTSGELVSGSLYYRSTSTGSKIYGWLTRLVADGKPVRIETNQSQLKTLAERNPQYFDAAFE